jgi:regulator of PEP synthase PpsR (kinase-PPPase family)
MNEQPVYIVSDHTGLTAESVARSLLAQFKGFEFRYELRPFMDQEKIELLRQELQKVAEKGLRPLVFSTLARPELLEPLSETPAVLFDLFGPYLKRLEEALGQPPARRPGRYHGIEDPLSYFQRIEAVDFALATDDGLGGERYGRAEVILIGVSRAGKTPTCLFLALQHGIKAANYPLTEEDLNQLALPSSLKPHRAKLYALTIEPERLAQIRASRRPGSVYASLERCRWEVGRAEALFRQEGILVFETTRASVEEIAAGLLQHLGRRKG